MVLKNGELTAYMPEFKDKERIPNPNYFTNVRLFLCWFIYQVLNTIDHGCLTKIARSYMEATFNIFYINKLSTEDIAQEYQDIE